MPKFKNSPYFKWHINHCLLKIHMLYHLVFAKFITKKKLKIIYQLYETADFCSPGHSTLGHASTCKMGWKRKHIMQICKKIVVTAFGS